jgi:hypothetical protein
MGEGRDPKPLSFLYPGGLGAVVGRGKVGTNTEYLPSPIPTPTTEP